MKTKRVLLSLITILAVTVGFSLVAGAVELVNINTASKEELMQLEGVGSAIADRIIEYREANGPFMVPEDIMKVKGIGTSTFEKNKERITVEEPGAG